jgi:hypothetical protein
MPSPQLFDIVQIGRNKQFIVTDIKPNRPRYPYVGVNANGRGTPYKFSALGATIVGHAPENHPALVAYRARRASVAPNDKGIILKLLDAVEHGDLATANILAGAARTMDCWRG